jgi:hypothetical protein
VIRPFPVTDISYDLVTSVTLRYATGLARVAPSLHTCLTVLGASLRKRLSMSRSRKRRTIPVGSSLATETGSAARRKELLKASPAVAPD